MRARSSDARHFGKEVRGLWGVGLDAGLFLSCFSQAGGCTYSVPAGWKVMHQMLEGGVGE